MTAVGRSALRVELHGLHAAVAGSCELVGGTQTASSLLIPAGRPARSTVARDGAQIFRLRPRGALVALFACLLAGCLWTGRAKADQGLVGAATGAVRPAASPPVDPTAEEAVSAAGTTRGAVSSGTSATPAAVARSPAAVASPSGTSASLPDSAASAAASPHQVAAAPVPVVSSAVQTGVGHASGPAAGTGALPPEQTVHAAATAVAGAATSAAPGSAHFAAGATTGAVGSATGVVPGLVHGTSPATGRVTDLIGGAVATPGQALDTEGGSNGSSERASAAVGERPSGPSGPPGPGAPGQPPRAFAIGASVGSPVSGDQVSAWVTSTPPAQPVAAATGPLIVVSSPAPPALGMTAGSIGLAAGVGSRGVGRAAPPTGSEAPVAFGRTTGLPATTATVGSRGGAAVDGHPVPAPSPGGTAPASATAAGFGISLFFVLMWLLFPGATALGRRLRLASKPLLPAPVVLLPERPG